MSFYVFLSYSLLQSLTSSLTLSTTLSYLILLLPSPIPAPSLEGSEVPDLEQWWLKSSAPPRTMQVMRNKPSTFLGLWNPPTSFRLAACLSLAKLGIIANVILQRNCSPCHQEKGRQKDTFLYLKPGTVSHLELTSQTLSGLGWRQGCCVAQGGVK